MHSTKELLAGTVIADVVFPLSFVRNVFTESVFHKSILPILKSQITILPLNLCCQTNSLISCIKELCELSSDDIDFELHCLELMCKIWRRLLLYISENYDFLLTPKAKSLQEQRIRDMLTYIQAHYNEKIAISSIAEAAHISRSECFRDFHSVIGKTPIGYLSDYRLAKACEILLSTDRTIADICYACGFHDTSYFGKIFKEKYGVSPGQYRIKQRMSS